MSHYTHATSISHYADRHFLKHIQVLCCVETDLKNVKHAIFFTTVAYIVVIPSLAQSGSK